SLSAQPSRCGSALCEAIHPTACLLFVSYRCRDHRDLPSFPTRRSSDLRARPPRVARRRLDDGRCAEVAAVVAHYTLTVYQADDVTPWFAVSTDPAHPHPYLHPPGEYDQGEIDLLGGRALVGEIQVRIIDPQTGADQSERWITERLGIPQDQEGAGHSAINGRRAVLKRASGRLVMDGVVTGVTLSESFAGFSFSLRDIRERHRRIALFSRTGTATVLPRGVVAGYGQLPGGGWLIEPTRPLRATFRLETILLGGAGYFDLAAYWRGAAIYDESATVPPELVLTPAMQEVLQAVDAAGRYIHAEVWWRPLSGDTSWRKITRPGGGNSLFTRRLLNAWRA